MSAYRALTQLAEEPLSLDYQTREALNEARGYLEAFDVMRTQQPTHYPAGRWTVAPVNGGAK